MTAHISRDDPSPDDVAQEGGAPAEDGASAQARAAGENAAKETCEEAAEATAKEVADETAKGARKSKQKGGAGKNAAHKAEDRPSAAQSAASADQDASQRHASQRHASTHDGADASSAAPPPPPPSAPEPPSAPRPDAGYAVMARRYRPQNFDELIGQDFLVRVLTNAFERGHIPHAMLLTGVRGVGKTTTARIIAKGLNCLEADRPTIAPCGRCANCRAIAESRHVDVLEMDAASRTGIDDIRDIIDGVAYRAAEARYKVYIIDETHMLSKSAFNGLLKTLEEPPAHVVFILATTDVEKVPVTVLSRCMRFDLRRVEPATMIAHLEHVCRTEAVAAAPEALALIARASEGSVRDALSLLDQAAAHASAEGIDEATTRDMLGLADRSAVLALFDRIMTGDAAGALEVLTETHAAGAEPAAALKDLGSFCHLATLARVAPGRLDAPELTEAERTAARDAATRFGPAALGRLWQMVLQALEEVERSPSALSAAEMAVIRMTHISELPPPEEILRRLNGDAADGASGPRAAPTAGSGTPPNSGARGQSVALGAAETRSAETRASANQGTAQAAASPRAASQVTASAGVSAPLSAAAPIAARTAAAPAVAQSAAKSVSAAKAAPAPAPAPTAAAPADFDAIVALIRAKRDAKLLVDVERGVRPGPVRPGSFEFTPAAGAPDDLAATLGRKLSGWTGRRWVVSISDGHAAPTLEETRLKAESALRQAAEAHPIVQAAMAAFPGLQIVDVSRHGAAGPDAGLGAGSPSAPPDDDEFFDRAAPPPAAGLADVVYDDGFEPGYDPEDPGADWGGGPDGAGDWEPDYAP